MKHLLCIIGLHKLESKKELFANFEGYKRCQRKGCRYKKSLKYMGCKRKPRK